MDRQHRTLIEGLVSNDLFVDAVGSAIGSEVSELTKKLRSAVRSGDLTAAADIGGQITGLERVISILRSSVSLAK